MSSRGVDWAKAIIIVTVALIVLGFVLSGREEPTVRAAAQCGFPTTHMDHPVTICCSADGNTVYILEKFRKKTRVHFSSDSGSTWKTVAEFNMR